MRIANFRSLTVVAILACTGTELAHSAQKPSQDLGEAAVLISEFTSADANAIPEELLSRAHGIAIIPNVFRGGFILGARRGRGVLSIRLDDGSWSNPAFIKLTGGSLGWQIGAETTDIVLVFANENAVRNIGSGKFTVGGEATAIAGPLRSQVASNVTFRAEVYGYTRSRGLYAGASFEGARLDIDEELGAAFYGTGVAQPLSRRSGSTPQAAADFLLRLERSTGNPYPDSPASSSGSGGSRSSGGSGSSGSSGATRTFPLDN